jgi:hypothetical protein
MGGPWRERGYDAREWRRPAPRVETRVEAVGGPREAGIVLAYAVSVVMSVVVLLVLVRLGW